MSRLFLDVAVGDNIEIGDVVVTLISKKGGKARLSIEADRSIKIELKNQERKLGNSNRRMSAI
jgi:sRNA-binding carbon storage regulator CsrA